MPNRQRELPQKCGPQRSGVSRATRNDRETSLNYNPLTVQSAALRARIQSLQSDSATRLAELDWYDTFAPRAAEDLIEGAKREASALETQINDLNGTLLPLAKRRVTTLTEESRLGWNPSRWLAPARFMRRADLAREQASLSDLQRLHKRLSSELRATRKRAQKAVAELERFGGYDRAAATTALGGLSAEITARELELETVVVRETSVDRELATPLKDLKRLKAAKRELERESDHATDLETRLSRAQTGYDRKRIHEECGGSFGESRPRAVIERKRRDLLSVERSIEKLQARLMTIAERASRDIKTIVIDGNNLCYSEQAFIGLAALKAITSKISLDLNVTVVFDASIRRQLSMSPADIRRHLGDAVTVHVVASGKKADETVIDLAKDAFVYILSNDMFAEFRDKPAVRARRVIRHEIINHRVLVHDLFIDETF
jgi:hypothetical protein